MNKFQNRVTTMIMTPIDEPTTFNERITQVEIVDEAGGELIKVTQPNDERADSENGILIDPGEWEHMKGLIEDMLGSLVDYDEKEKKC